MTTPRPQFFRLWDLPTRLFHWLLVSAVATAIGSGLAGGNWMDIHGRCGLAICGLLVFRFVWGFIGNRYARFQNFLPTPSLCLAYFRGTWRGQGHNPLGALSVLTMLSLLSAQVGTGLFGNDEIAFTGPLISLVNDSLSLRLTGLHHQLAVALYVLLALHVLAILHHTAVKKHNLIVPMVTGYKETPDIDNVAPVQTTGWIGFLVALGISAGAVYLASGAMLQSERPAPTSTGLSSVPPKPTW